MAKKRKEDAPPPGAPAWMATFGDLMNLLLCFFVLLFASSSPDAEKFEQIAASFAKQFSVLSGGASAIGDGILISNGVSQLNELDEFINSMGMAAEESSDTEEMDEIESITEAIEDAKMKLSEQLAEQVQEVVDEKNLQNQVEVEFTSQYVQLTMNGSVLFESGKAEIKEEVTGILQTVGVILEKYATSTIEIEGHTDNVPITGGRYANNNELSSFRALSVLEFFESNTSLNPANIKTSGRGEYVPIADNSTPEGRSKNRRVVIRIYHDLSTY